jgi:hypothetical protein
LPAHSRRLCQASLRPPHRAAPCMNYAPEINRIVNLHQPLSPNGDLSYNVYPIEYNISITIN